MAFRNKQLSNPKTKQDIIFRQTAHDTDGKLLEMDVTYHSHSKEPAPHYHPSQVEDFTVLSGQLTVRMDGKIYLLNPGDTLHIAANKVHAMWNNTTAKTVVNWKIQPAMDAENFLETTTGLAIDGKTNENGMPDILQLALLANKYSAVFRLSKPSYTIQKMVFFVLIPFACLFGYKATYKKYID